MSKHKPAKDDSRRAQLRAAQQAAAQREKNKRIVIGVVIAAVVVALVAAVALLVVRFKQAEAANFPPNATAQKDAIAVFPGSAKQGAPMVALYADYQCPACKQFEDRFGKTLEEMARSGEVQLAYHTMTFLDTNLRNDSSTRAANAAACADVAGHYADYHDAVFASQPQNEGSGYTDDQLTKQFTAQAGITGESLDTFNQCYTTKRMSGFVKSVDEAAGKANITQTPTIRVNGKQLDTKNLTSDPNSLRTEIMKLK